MRRSRHWLMLLLLLGLAACGRGANQPLFGLSLLSPAMVVSVSEDGRYAVSSHENKNFVLWDIQRRTHEIISGNANIYSAYLIQGRDIFLWQDLDDVVHVQHVDGEVLERFAHFPTYGHVMAPDLETYLASDEDWGLYLGHGEAMLPLKDDGDSPSFPGSGKLLNLTLSAKGDVALSSGTAFDTADEIPITKSPPLEKDAIFSDYAGVVLWDLDTHQPLHKLSGNAVKTHATLSPDGKYVVSGDENRKTYVWDARSGELVNRPARVSAGVYITPKQSGKRYGDFDDSRLIDGPDDLDEEPVVNISFVGSRHYARIYAYSHYATLFSVDSPWPIKHFDLGTDPHPVTNDYSRNAAIDSAPHANLLVTGQRSGGGINVYRFDPEAQTLERIWAPSP